MATIDLGPFEEIVGLSLGRPKIQSFHVYAANFGPGSDGYGWMNAVCQANGVHFHVGGGSAGSRTALYVQFGLDNAQESCRCGTGDPGVGSGLASAVIEAGGVVCVSGEHSSCMSQQDAFDGLMTAMGSGIRHKRGSENPALGGVATGLVRMTLGASGGLILGGQAVALSQQSGHVVFAHERIGRGDVFALADSNVFGIPNCGANYHGSNAPALRTLLRRS